MNQSLKLRIVRYYCFIFYVLLLYKWLNGMLLYQEQPSFFYLRYDIFSWLFIQTGIHQWLLNNPIGCLLFDLLFYCWPAIYLYTLKYQPKKAKAFAIGMLLINWCYVECYTLYATNSMEGHIGWLLFPIVFIPNKEKIFELLFEGLRYFFLFFFVSAGIWKFAQHGIFNATQMSGILLYQHNDLLKNSPEFWQTKMIDWLIIHQTISYLLYLSATLMELSFVIGFFTKKYDRYLIVAFLMFLVMDHLIMRIPYYEILPFILTLLFSRKIITSKSS